MKKAAIVQMYAVPKTNRTRTGYVGLLGIFEVGNLDDLFGADVGDLPAAVLPFRGLARQASHVQDLRGRADIVGEGSDLAFNILENHYQNLLSNSQGIMDGQVCEAILGAFSGHKNYRSLPRRKLLVSPKLIISGNDVFSFSRAPIYDAALDGLETERVTINVPELVEYLTDLGICGKASKIAHLESVKERRRKRSLEANSDVKLVEIDGVTHELLEGDPLFKLDPTISSLEDDLELGGLTAKELIALLPANPDEIGWYEFVTTYELDDLQKDVVKAYRERSMFVSRLDQKLERLNMGDVSSVAIHVAPLDFGAFSVSYAVESLEGYSLLSGDRIFGMPDLADLYNKLRPFTNGDLRETVVLDESKLTLDDFYPSLESAVALLEQ
jgi:hypothetical protein